MMIKIVFKGISGTFHKTEISASRDVSSLSTQISYPSSTRPLCKVGNGDFFQGKREKAAFLYG